MSIVVPNVMEVEVLNFIFLNLHKLRLFSNNIVPAETDTLASFVEVIPGASGYAEIDLHSANWVKTPGSPSVALYDPIEWLFTGVSGGTGFVYGYYVVDAVSGLLRYSERFPTAPFTPVAGARIRFTPRFECAQMPSVEKLWTGTLAEAALGIPLTSFDGGWCVPEGITISAAISGLLPSQGAYSLITYPGTEVDTGSDHLGQMGTLLSFANSGDYLTYGTSNGDVTFVDGPFKMSVRTEVNFIDLDAIVELNVTISPGFPLDQYVEDTEFPVPTDLTVDPGVEDFLDLMWQHQYLLEDEVGFEVQKSTDDGVTWETIALIPPPIDATDDIYETEVPFEDAIYRVRAYNSLLQTYSSWSTDVVSPEEPPPDLQYTPVGGIKLGTISVGEINQAGPIGFVLYSDPSGLYTIVEGQYYDRLYNRATGEYIDVAIPNPFVKTGYIP